MEKFSRAWWWTYFQQNQPVSKSQLESLIGGPLWQNGRTGQVSGSAKNLFFAGTLYPTDSTYSNFTLGGGNGESATDLLTTFRTPDDSFYNPAADLASGWKIVVRSANSQRGFSYVVQQAPVTGWAPEFLYTGRRMVPVGEILLSDPGSLPRVMTGTAVSSLTSYGWDPTKSVIVPREIGLTDPTVTPAALPPGAGPTGAEVCATYKANADKEIGNFLANYAGKSDTDEIAPGVQKGSALLSLKARWNNTIQALGMNCPTAYPEAIGASLVASGNNVAIPTTAEPAPNNNTPLPPNLSGPLPSGPSSPIGAGGSTVTGGPLIVTTGTLAPPRPTTPGLPELGPTPAATYAPELGTAGTVPGTAATTAKNYRLLGLAALLVFLATRGGK